MSQRNLTTYQKKEVVDFYVHSSRLQPAEDYLFGKYVKQGHDVLDLGVGGGRTTPRLSSLAARYVGVDYSPEMMAACRARFPHLEFLCADASRLDMFADASFDVLVFSFNGIDCIETFDGRMQCWKEIGRILRPGGVAILSSCNAKALAPLPDYSGADPLRVVWRTFYAAYSGVRLATSRLTSRPFYVGHGFVRSKTHGGLRLYACTPAAIESQAASVSLTLEERVPFHMKQVPTYFIGWYYYAVRKPCKEAPASGA